MPQGDHDGLDENSADMGLILVVEDDERTRRLERFVLEDEGFSVFEVRSGEEALDALDEERPTLILLDIGLPGIDGFATCQRIRELSEIPIIIVTGEDWDEDKVRGLELGADDYVTKPFSTTELAARVKAVIRRYKPVDLPTPPPPSSPPPDPGIRGQKGSGPVNDELYEGIVKLVVVTTGSIRGMIHFVDELRQSEEFHLLRLVADQNREGMDIWIRLRGPITLRHTLLSIEGVSKVEKSDAIVVEDGEQALGVSLSI